MGRGIVLFACLLAAGIVAAYTHYSERSASQTPVYTVMVPQRAPEPPPAPSPAPVVAVPPPPTPKAIATPGDRASLARELQRELKRVGCYGGEINGVWTTSSRMAMKAFTDKVNATLPIDNPDYILLSLVQQRQEPVCGAPDSKLGVTEAKAAPPSGDTGTTTATIGAAVPAAAAVTALTAATPAPAAPKAEPQVAPPERAKPAAVTPAPPQPPPKVAPSDAAPKAGGPVPPARVYGRRSHRYGNRTVRPPRIVRNVLRALGFR